MNTTNTTTIKSTNPEYGFSGTIQRINGLTDEQAAAAFVTAALEIMKHTQFTEAADAIKILDSRIGRHLADEAQSEHLVAVVLNKWMSNKRFARQIRAELAA